MNRLDSIQIGDLKGLALCGIAAVMGTNHSTVISKLHRIGETLGQPVYESQGPGPNRGKITEFGREYAERAEACVRAWEG